MVPLDDAPRRGHQQREGEIGGGVGEHIGSIRDQDPFARGGGDVNVVETHGDVRDAAHALQAADRSRVEAVGELAHDGLLAPDAASQLFGR